MSRRVLRSVLYAILASAALAAGAIGLVRADSTATNLGMGLQLPPTPALLGPIDESGRVGWACAPEIAAAARGAKAAELPSATRP